MGGLLKWLVCVIRRGCYEICGLTKNGFKKKKKKYYIWPSDQNFGEGHGKDF